MSYLLLWELVLLDLGCGELEEFPGQVGLTKERRPGREVTAGHRTLRMD